MLLRLVGSCLRSAQKEKSRQKSSRTRPTLSSPTRSLCKPFSKNSVLKRGRPRLNAYSAEFPPMFFSQNAAKEVCWKDSSTKIQIPDYLRETIRKKVQQVIRRRLDIGPVGYILASFVAALHTSSVQLFSSRYLSCFQRVDGKSWKFNTKHAQVEMIKSNVLVPDEKFVNLPEGTSKTFKFLTSLLCLLCLCVSSHLPRRSIRGPSCGMG